MSAPLHFALAGAGIISLRAYQSNVVDATRAALRAGKRRVLAYLPTGGGKTSLGTPVKRRAWLSCSRVHASGKA